MKKATALVALFFYSKESGHTHVIIDAESHIADGGTESSAIDWAYEKYGEGRDVVSCEFGHEDYVNERIKIAHHVSREVETKV
jgi:hypothetical protein